MTRERRERKGAGLTPVTVAVAQEDEAQDSTFYSSVNKQLLCVRLGEMHLNKEKQNAPCCYLM